MIKKICLSFGKNRDEVVEAGISQLRCDPVTLRLLEVGATIPALLKVCDCDALFYTSHSKAWVKREWQV